MYLIVLFLLITFNNNNNSNNNNNNNNNDNNNNNKQLQRRGFIIYLLHSGIYIRFFFWGQLLKCVQFLFIKLKLKMILKQGSILH